MYLLIRRWTAGFDGRFVFCEQRNNVEFEVLDLYLRHVHCPLHGTGIFTYMIDRGSI